MTSPTHSSFDIAIHGAGFVGQTLALLLAQQDWRVALWGDEPTQSPRLQDIRAFALNHAARDVLTRIGAWPDAQAVTPVHAMQVFGDEGAELMFGDALATLNWIVDVPALDAVLKQQVSREPRVVCLASQTAVQAKLHVVCEGRASKKVSELGVVQRTIQYHQHAVAARLVCERPHGNVARQWFNARGEILALLPLQGHGGHEVALVWSLQSPLAKERQAGDEALFIDALETACGKALGAMKLSGARASWSLQLTKNWPWTGVSASLGTWVLAGDAAHAMHPLAGQGLNAGLGDAALLAQTLQAVRGDSPLFMPTSAQLTRALRRYARARQAAFDTMAGVTDGLHLLFAHQGAWVARVRNAGMGLLNRAEGIKNFLIQRAQ